VSGGASSKAGTHDERDRQDLEGGRGRGVREGKGKEGKGKERRGRAEGDTDAQPFEKKNSRGKRVMSSRFIGVFYTQMSR